jgi:hypothetical protein
MNEKRFVSESGAQAKVDEAFAAGVAHGRAVERMTVCAWLREAGGPVGGAIASQVEAAEHETSSAELVRGELNRIRVQAREDGANRACAHIMAECHRIFDGSAEL